MARAMEFLVICTVSSPRGTVPCSNEEHCGNLHCSRGNSPRNQSSCKEWSPNSPSYGLINHEQASILASLPRLSQVQSSPHGTGQEVLIQDKTSKVTIACHLCHLLVLLSNVLKNHPDFLVQTVDFILFFFFF